LTYNPADTTTREELSGLLGIVILLTWTVFLLAPFIPWAGIQSGVFVPSDQWKQQELQAIGWATLYGAIAFAAATVTTFTCLGVIKRANGNQPSDFPPRLRKVFLWSLGVIFLLLPLWGWKLERGAIIDWAHNTAPTLERVETSAFVTSYYRVLGKSTFKDRLYLRVPPYGRMREEILPDLKPEVQLESGLEIPISGRRTWVGTFYEKLEWPEEWLLSDKQ
jgi:hypothetical protein